MKTRKVIFGSLLSLGLVLTLAGCGSQAKSAAGKTTKHSVALVTDGGGIDDKSFNQSAWEGLKSWGKENKFAKGVGGYDYAQSTSASDFTPNINKLIKAKYKTIFGIGYQVQKNISDSAKQNSDVNFAIVDSVIPNQKNVASVMFKAEQSSFLAGVAAAETTKTNKVGFVGGVKSDIIEGFQAGFEQGVKAVNKNITIDVKYAGSFSKADLGKSLADAMYNNKEDVIYQAAGGTGNGVFTSAKSLAKDGKKVWVIGVDRDQKSDGKYSGGNVTLASSVKEVGTAVQDLSDKALKGNFPGGKTIEYDLKDKGVTLVNDNMPASTVKKVNAYKAKIINGDISVSAKTKVD
ncbi:BMP family lipoprotein [Dellaglioa sp. BT-FLS60]